MNSLTYLLTALEGDISLYLVLILGACLGCILGLLGSYLLWNRTCKAAEDDADMHMDIALGAIREKNLAVHKASHLERQNAFLTSMLSGENFDGEGYLIPGTPEDEDFSNLPRDIQFPPKP